MNCETYKMHPSPVIQAKGYGLNGQTKVWIPENEIFRIRNIFEDKEYHIPPHFIPSGSLTIVDIGANVGLFALYMKSLRQDCDIHCFEPVPQTVELLKRNTAHDPRIHVHPYALSDHEKIAALYLHPANSGENSLKSGITTAVSAVQVRVENASTTMSQIGISYIDVLKIDTEGSEVEILESLRSLLPYVGILMIEFHSEKDRRDIDALLKTHILFHANICKPNLGVVKYINARLI